MMKQASRPIALVIASLGAIGAMLSYVQCSSQSNPMDAGPTSDVVDERDAQPDAGLDVAQDSSCKLPNVSSDWPGWRRLTEVDACCLVDVPVDVASSVPPFDWKSCQNGRPSCMQVDNIKYNVNGGGAIRDAYGSRSGDAIALGLELDVTKDPVSVQSEWVVYQRVSGTPLAAWRYQTSGEQSCIVGPTFGNTTITAMATRALPNSIEVKLATGTPAALMTTPVFHATLASTNQFEIPEGISNSDSLIVFDQQTRGRFVRTKPSSSAYVTTTTPPALVEPYVHGDVGFGRDPFGNGGWSQYWRVNPDGTLTLFRAKASTHITALTSDADTFYWAESWGGTNMGDPTDQPHVEIWTAPFTDDPATLTTTAKMLVKLDGKMKRPARLTAQNGFVAVTAFLNIGWGFYVVRKSDSAMTTIDAYLAGEGVGDPLYLSQTEVWAPVHLANDPATVVMKITLGAW